MGPGRSRGDLRRSGPVGVALESAVADGEPDPDCGDTYGESGPQDGPIGGAVHGIRVRPPFAAEVSKGISHATEQEDIEGLGAGAPCGIDALLEVDLGGDQIESESAAVHGDAHEEPERGIQCARGVAEDAEANPGEKDGFQSPTTEESGEEEHGEDLCGLAKGHPRGRALEAEFLEMARSVGVEGAEGDIKEGGGEKDDAMIAMLEEGESIEAEALFPR